MSEPIAISVKNVSKDFRLPHQKMASVKDIFVRPLQALRGGKIIEVQHALSGISFDVKEGEFFGIVGRNGSGKSTLLKILADIYQPTSGEVSVKGRLVPFIELGVGFNPELTGRENVYLSGALNGFSEKEIDYMYDDIVEFAELEPFMDQQLKNYSSGMQVRLAFSVATRAKADILLIDEVLAVGDADFQRKCFTYFKELKKNKKTVVFVSHDMGAIREFCDEAALIDNNNLIEIGKPEKISSAYSRLFITSDKDSGKVISDRWGDKGAEYVSPKVLLENQLTFSVDIRVNEVIDQMVYGIHILGADGREITAMNNRMVKLEDITDTNPGDVVHLKWSMPNIFNDGEYFVTLTLIDDVSNTLDWWVNATSFKIRREERSTTSVLPPVSASYKINDTKRER